MPLRAIICLVGCWHWARNETQLGCTQQHIYDNFDAARQQHMDALNSLFSRFQPLT